MVTEGSYSGEIIIPETITYEGEAYTVTSIGENAFKGTSITSLTIPATVETIADKAIMNCKSLGSIECKALNPPVMTSHPFHAMNSALEHLVLTIPAQSVDKYLNDENWSIVMYDPTRVDISAGEEYIIRTHYELDDKLAVFEEHTSIHYELDANGDTVHWHYENHDSTYNEYSIVEYKRTFKNTNWQALYVPLEFGYNDWKDKFEIARIDDVLEFDTDSDGMYDNFYALATVMAENDSVQPHKLYLIRALEVSPEGGDVITVSKYHRVDVDGEPLYRVYTNVISDSIVADDVQTFVAKGSGNVYTFRGQYRAGNVVEGRDANGEPVQPYRYAMAAGELKRPNPSITAGVPLGAFRWWLEVTPGAGASEIANRSVGFRTLQRDYTTSAGCVEINLNEIEGLGIYYDLGGRRVDEPRKGVFICNGKKILLR